MPKRDISFSLLLALALALTIGLKFRIAAAEREPDSALLTREIAATLAQQGFATRMERNHYQSDIVDAVRGTCHMRVRDGAHAGQLTQVFARETEGLGPVRYYHTGRWHDAPPLWRMAAERYVSRIAARMGFAGTIPVVLAAASRGCEEAMPNFNSLSQSWTAQGQS